MERGSRVEYQINVGYDRVSDGEKYARDTKAQDVYRWCDNNNK
jgi:hypothetical protein